MAVPNEKRVQEALDNLQLMQAEIVDALTPAIDAFMAFCKELGRTLSAVVERLGQIVFDDQMEFIVAYSWAQKSKPEWVHRLNHTKKKRTRKKYQDMILRSYREERKHHENHQSIG